MNHRDIAQGRKKLSPNVLAVFAAVISLVAALGVLAILKSLGLSHDAVIVTVILLLPLFVYLAVSGKLKELGAPGGWLVKFTQTARERLTDFECITPTPIRVHIESMGPSPEDSAKTQTYWRWCWWMGLNCPQSANISPTSGRI